MTRPILPFAFLHYSRTAHGAILGGQGKRGIMRGQTLVEVLIALGIITIIITALAGVVVTSMGNARNSKDQNQATQYAQEGMEIVRQIRDSDYVTFRNKAGTYCLGGSNTLGPDCSSANVDSFLRKVIVTQGGCGTNVAQIVVTVSWQDSKCSAGNPFCRISRFESCLSTVNPVPTL